MCICFLLKFGTFNIAVYGCVSARIPLPRGASATRNADYSARSGAVPKTPGDGYTTWAGSRGMLGTPGQLHAGAMGGQGLPDGYFFPGGGLQAGTATVSSGAMFTTAATGENSQMSVDSGSKRIRDTRADRKADKKKYGITDSSMV